jgi:hypothetical protein
MNPNTCAPAVPVFIQIQLELRIISERYWTRIEFDPHLFRFTLGIDFDRLPGLHHLGRGIEGEKQANLDKVGRMGEDE